MRLLDDVREDRLAGVDPTAGERPPAVTLPHEADSAVLVKEHGARVHLRRLVPVLVGEDVTNARGLLAAEKLHARARHAANLLEALAVEDVLRVVEAGLSDGLQLSGPGEPWLALLHGRLPLEPLEKLPRRAEPAHGGNVGTLGNALPAGESEVDSGRSGAGRITGLVTDVDDLVAPTALGLQIGQERRGVGLVSRDVVGADHALEAVRQAHRREAPLHLRARLSGHGAERHAMF